ncbi:ACP S-malonyltransferase [Legionella yabuuchiae]|uniref:ACP S-malonyltransferase n=1 Tax=Legionella yabuuchiae TaxID=376727 RepID=UPI0010547C2B|nr:ACP S-malonyltransferase [Legionella yabuuchiae]
MKTISFVFPGQGSQYVGMLNDLAQTHSLISELFSEVSERLGYDVWDLVQNGPEEKLNQTECTQVAMLTADVAIYKTLQQQQIIPPSVMAGHSLGEYAALVCANAISLPDAAELVAKRGQLMQQTVPLGKGAMAAVIGLDDEAVRKLCEQVSTSEFLVTPANYNAIGQIVIAGHTPAVEQAVSLALEQGAKLAKIIPVSVPCHCQLLTYAADVFAESLENAPFKTPEVPVISNVNLTVYESPEQIRTLLKAQLYKPVRWVETIQLMKAKGVELLIECGPGKVLSGLVKRIDRSLKTLSIHDESSLSDALREINQ